MKMCPFVVAAALATGLLSRTASAQDMIIERPGAHLRYGVEIEPKFDFTFIDSGRARGLGAGVRFSIPLVNNGFVKSINNSVAIGFGADYVSYSGCYRASAFGDCSGISAIWFPVVMQWNFFLTKDWSVLGEPGISLYRISFGDLCSAPGEYCSSTSTGADVVLALGGRYHFAEHESLTMRLGFDLTSGGGISSVGVSFF